MVYKGKKKKTKNIVIPFNLKNTYYGDNTNTTEDESNSYKYQGKWVKEPETDMSIPQGAGAIVSNPTDINSFVEQLFLGNIISEESLKLMKTIKNGYGMGLFQFPYNDKVSFGHTGGIDGFQLVTSYFPEEKLAISLTSNGANYDKNNILLTVLAAYFNEPYELPTFTQIDLTTEDLHQYLGTFASTDIPIKIIITKKTSYLPKPQDKESFR